MHYLQYYILTLITIHYVTYGHIYWHDYCCLKQYFSAKSFRFTSLCFKTSDKDLYVAAEPRCSFQYNSIRNTLSWCKSKFLHRAWRNGSSSFNRRPSWIHLSSILVASLSNSSFLGAPSLSKTEKEFASTNKLQFRKVNLSSNKKKQYLVGGQL